MATAMKCPACGCRESDVKDSRPTKTMGTRRRRQCAGCGYRFTTGEFVIEAGQEEMKERTAMTANLRPGQREAVYRIIREFESANTESTG